ncbi:MAG TPA: hypothetical protein VKA46_23265, partial [Gemmataceae bacterium]|nr:hypothetical protein [Gemmataceae bacterium]
VRANRHGNDPVRVSRESGPQFWFLPGTSIDQQAEQSRAHDSNDKCLPFHAISPEMNKSRARVFCPEYTHGGSEASDSIRMKHPWYLKY